MHRYWIILFFLLFIQDYSICQKFLQLEKMNSPKTRKYPVGSEITFQLKGGQWYTRVIEDVSFDQNLILFAYGHAKVEDITAFRSFQSQKWSRPLGNQLYNFAIAWTGFSLIAAAVDKDDTYSKGDITVAATSVATGFVIQQIFKKRTFNLAKSSKGQPRKWRLRVLDLDVKPK